jgi:hypothetical protein
MQKMSRTNELILTVDDGIFGSSNQNARPHGSISLMGIPIVPTFMTLPSEAFPATYAIQNLRTMRQYSNANPSSSNDTQQAVNPLRRAYLVQNLHWPPPLHLSSSAGLYANAAVSNARWSSPLNSIDVMSQILISQRRINPHFPLSYEARLLSASAEPPRTPPHPPMRIQKPKMMTIKLLPKIGPQHMNFKNRVPQGVPCFQPILSQSIPKRIRKM